MMMHGQSECNLEQTTTGGPVLEEFIPLKSSRSHDGDGLEEDDEQYSHKKKSDWLRSVQLWNPSPDPTPKEVPELISSTSIRRATNLSKKKKEKEKEERRRKSVCEIAWG